VSAYLELNEIAAHHVISVMSVFPFVHSFHSRNSMKTIISLCIIFLSTTVMMNAQIQSERRFNHYDKPLFSFLFPKIQGSGVPLTSERATKPFRAIVVEDPFRIVIRQGASHQVTIVSDDNLAEYIHTSVSENGVLTIAMDMRNYYYDTLSVFITTPMFDELTIGIGARARVEEPLILPQLTTNLAGVGCSITFGSGKIDKHTINVSGIGSNIRAASIQTEEATVRMEGIGTDCSINAARIEPIGGFGIGASLHYSLVNGKQPNFIGLEGKGLGASISEIREHRQPIIKKLPAQAPLPIPSKD
jgi:Putative auto-transporter adhesin, head GIN domain